MAHRHRLDHVQGLAGAALTDDDPVGPHVQGVAQQVADRDLALALEVRRPGLQRDDVLLAELQLGGVLDRDDPLVVGDEGGEDVEGGGLARAGAAGDEDVEAGLDARLQEVEHLRRRGPEADEVVHREGGGGELPDRDHGTDEGERRDDRVDAGAVGQAGVDPRARLVDAPSEGGDDPVDDPEHVLVVQEDAIDALDLPGPLDVDLVRAVDHDLGDRLVAKERLERPETPDLSDHAPRPGGDARPS